MAQRINDAARPTGTLAGLIGILLLISEQVGLNLSPELASAIIIVPAAAISYGWPRWAKQQGVFFRHPAAISGAVAAIIVAVAPLLDLSVTTAEATIFVAGITALVSVATPRNRPGPRRIDG
jgi:hypothetical protein